MGKDVLDVFLSSDQVEFDKLRGQLSDEINNIPFLKCSLLEDEGADSSSVLEASLKAVRDSDIYVGVFGQEYSETTIREYLEAVKFRKPCLIYVKKVRERDKELVQFINDVLKNDFKYFPFERNKEAVNQLNVDLHKFILGTLKIGLDERTKKKKATMDLISIEEKDASKAVQAPDPLADSERLFIQGKYLESLVMTTIIVEKVLRQFLTTNKLLRDPKKSLGQMINVVQHTGAFSPGEVRLLRTISIYRNKAVHLGLTPDREEIRKVLDNGRRFIALLVKMDSLKEKKMDQNINRQWKPLPKRAREI